MIIALDGPSASGKGTIARRLAEYFNLPYLNTGLLYRAVTYALLQQGGKPADEDAAALIAYNFRNGFPEKMLHEPELRSEIVSREASQIAAMPRVREHLLGAQKAFAAQPGGAVLDGRDIGTIIAPHAEIKLYITATPGVRAERRMKELQSQGRKVTYEAVLADLEARDARDANRATAPAKPAKDAVTLDTSNLNAEEAFASALHIVKNTMRA